VDVVKQFYYRK